MDVLTPQQRSYNMSRIGTRNTKPEIILRKSLFRRGLRFRLHRKDLPGTPDLVFPRFRAAVFVHGCFWHGHGCHLFVVPAQNRDFWIQKINANQARDKRADAALQKGGWRVLTVWECALRGRLRSSPDDLARKIERWLKNGDASSSLPSSCKREDQR
jgi:DNA mismatch endonuclease (patch repair protein)